MKNVYSYIYITIETAPVLEFFINYGHSAYSYLWYAWVIICVQYYVFSINLFTSVMFLCRKSILYFMMGIELPSLLLSILYLHVSVLWLHFVFLITDLMHGNWKYLILSCYHVNSGAVTLVWLVSGCMLGAALHFSLLPSLDPFLIRCATPSTILSIGWISAWLLGITAVSIFVFCHFSTCFCAVCGIVLLFMHFIASSSLFSFHAFHITFLGSFHLELLTGAFICLSDCSLLLYYLSHYIIIIYAILIFYHFYNCIHLLLFWSSPCIFGIFILLISLQYFILAKRAHVPIVQITINDDIFILEWGH